MVKGIGVDIIEIERIEKSIRESGDHILHKIFTPQEIAYCNSKPKTFQHFAARFAAKEALSKALATGWAGKFNWKDVEVTNESSGQPRIELHGKLQEALAHCSVLVSLSHSESHVVAMIVIEETVG